MQAQRFPTDFDGIVAGAPAYDFTRIAVSCVTHAKATFADPAHLTTSAVSPADLALNADSDNLSPFKARQVRSSAVAAGL